MLGGQRTHGSPEPCCQGASVYRRNTHVFTVLFCFHAPLPWLLRDTAQEPYSPLAFKAVQLECNCHKLENRRVGETVLPLGVASALSEDLGSVPPPTRQLTPVYNLSSKGSEDILLASGYCTYRYTHRSNTLTH